MEKDEVKDKIIKSIEGSKYKWRTINGIASDLNVPREVVYSYLVNSKEIVKANNPNQNGHELFTTRNKQRQQTSWGKLLLSTLLNKASIE